MRRPDDPVHRRNPVENHQAQLAGIEREGLKCRRPAAEELVREGKSAAEERATEGIEAFRDSTAPSQGILVSVVRLDVLKNLQDELWREGELALVRVRKGGKLDARQSDFRSFEE